jgi:hypothetical protein
VPIQQGDRVRITTGQEGTVELITGGGTLAYVQLDENPNGVTFSLYESHALTKIDKTDHASVGPNLKLCGG